MKYVWIVLAAVVAIGAIVYFILPDTFSITNEPADTTPADEPMPVEPDGGIGDGAGPLNDENGGDEEGELPDESVIGQSAGGDDILAFHFGDGEKEVLFVGGIHGGYSYNTAALGYELVDYLDANPDMVPENLRVTVIPVLNPDGLDEIVGTTGRFDVDAVTMGDTARVEGRFNNAGVDINRNFDCEWQSTGTWQNQEVDGGDEPFSEPESRAVRDYVQTHNIVGAVAYYSQAGGVFSSNCRNGILSETAELTNLYAEAASYPASEEFDFYEITGDMVNWMASENIPAISVLLTNHEEIEWSRNQAGIEAVLNYFAE